MILRQLLLLIAYAIILDAPAQTLSKKQQKAVTRIDAYLTSRYGAAEPGAIILIAEKGEILYKKALGLSNLTQRNKLSVDNQMPIASMTKQFTAVCILQLAEGNKLLLTDSIQKYIPEFPLKGKKVTIQHLLTQTSGIREYFDVEESEYDMLTQEYQPMQVIELFKNDPLEFDAGTQFRYSNSNYFLLGLIVERVSGKPFGQYLIENIFSPLKMNHSFYWYGSTSTDKSEVIGYQKKAEGYQPALKVNGSIWYGSGGITSTVEDLFTWNQAILKTGFLRSNKLLTQSATLTNGQKTGYSFGFFLRTLQGEPTLQHGGNIYGFTSSGLYLPENDIYISILSNRGFEPTELLANYLASELIGKPIEPPSSFALNPQRLADYTGTYQLTPDMKRTMNIIIVSDRLVLTFPEQKGAEVDILPVSDDKFESKKVNATLEFQRDGNGKVKSIVIDQKGKTAWVKVQ